MAYDMLHDVTGPISSLRQRTDLADVIAEISGFATTTGRSVLMGHQVRTALADRFSAPAPAPADVCALMLGWARDAGREKRAEAKN